MRKLVLRMSVSLDGYVAGPNGELAWIFRAEDEEPDDDILETLPNTSAHLMGYTTFQDMASWWPASTEPIAAAMNEVPKIIFSRHRKVLQIDPALTSPGLKDAANAVTIPKNSEEVTQRNLESWKNARLMTGDLATSIMKLKAEEGKELLAHGGASFARSLIQTGLIDEYRFQIHPIILGAGMPIFNGREKPLDLKVVESKVQKSGVVAIVYRPEA